MSNEQGNLKGDGISMIIIIAIMVGFSTCGKSNHDFLLMDL